MTSRLALDVRRVTLTFDPDDPAIAIASRALYRHGYVVLHETRAARVDRRRRPAALADRLSSSTSPARPPR